MILGCMANPKQQGRHILNLLEHYVLFHLYTERRLQLKQKKLHSKVFKKMKFNLKTRKLLLKNSGHDIYLFQSKV